MNIDDKLVLDNICLINEARGNRKIEKLEYGRIIFRTDMYNNSDETLKVYVLTELFNKEKLLFSGEGDVYEISSKRGLKLSSNTVMVYREMGEDLFLRVCVRKNSDNKEVFSKGYLLSENCKKFSRVQLMEDVRINTDYPEANVDILSFFSNSIKFQADERDSVNWLYYFNFEISSQKDVSFMINLQGMCKTYCYSKDGGRSWIPEHMTDMVSLKAGETVRYASSIPYVKKNLDDFIEKIAADKRVAVKNLCYSEEGRTVPIIVLGGEEGSKKKILFTCRHHCSEAVASYALEGTVDKFLEQDNAFFEKYVIYAVPMMDIDGVENGDQGKNRYPHDHNRDYGVNRYKSVAAVSEFFGNEEIELFFDYHNPWNEPVQPYFYIYKDTLDEFNKYADILKRKTEGDKICYDGKTDFGPLEYVENNASGHFRKLNSAKISTTIEVPFNNPQNFYYADDFRLFGKRMGEAFLEYLKL